MMTDETDATAALQLTSVDYVTSAAKAVLGAIPFAGSLLTELAGSVIPNQRIDRLTKFAINLEEKLSRLDQEFVRLQLKDENFTDLLEEGVRQAALFFNLHVVRFSDKYFKRPFKNYITIFEHTVEYSIITIKHSTSYSSYELSLTK